MRTWKFWRNKNSSRSTASSKRLRLEQLEDKRLLAIVWANEFGTGLNDPDFDDEYLADEFIARAIVNRAIDDWNAVVTDQNFDNDNNDETNDFQLNVFADDLGDGLRGQTGNIQYTTGEEGPEDNHWRANVPMSADITLNDDGGGTGWFFDTTPLDDIEFTSIADDFQASFIDASTVFIGSLGLLALWVRCLKCTVRMRFPLFHILCTI